MIMKKLIDVLMGIMTLIVIYVLITLINLDYDFAKWHWGFRLAYAMLVLGFWTKHVYKYW